LIFVYLLIRLRVRTQQVGNPASTKYKPLNATEKRYLDELKADLVDAYLEDPDSYEVEYFALRIAAFLGRERI